MRLAAMELDHLALFVVDLAVSIAFYREAMGLEQIDDPFHDDLHAWFRVGPQLSLHVIGGAAARSAHDIGVHFALRTGGPEGLDALMRHLDAMGVAYQNFLGTAKVNVRPDGIRQIYLQDPDGYWIEVNDAAV
jgi:lactoylglutathione lyase